MRKIWIVSIIILAAAAVAAALAIPMWRSARTGPTQALADHAGSNAAGAPHEASPTLYQCPMHPSYISEKPGDCPICAMRLVRVEEEPGHPAGHTGGGALQVPEVPQPRPTVEGYTTISVPAHKQQYIGVKTEPVERRPIVAKVHSVGRVDYHEPGLSWVNARVSGWIEVLKVDRTGDFVRKGEPLLEIYSPDLVATQEEYLVAVQNLRRLEESGALPKAVEQARALLEGARRRLSLWDIPEAQVRALEERGTIARRMTLEAPVSGYVVEKRVLQGKFVSPGEDLYRIADLSRVWVLAEVYESEVSRLEAGQSADIQISYLPGEKLQGKVDYIYPYLNPETRTVLVRLVVPNPSLTLRPEMYANVEFHVPERIALAVPNEAVMDTGERQIAFVSLGDGVFEPRQLRVGLRTRDYTVVLEGLAEGDLVVTSGNFLIDSESRLKAAMAGMSAGPGEHRHGN